MKLIIEEFPLADFDDLIPLLMRCFPDFWSVRLAQGKYSFPYDLILYSARLDGKLIGCIGIHEYPFFFAGEIIRCGGISDVAVDPDFRGRGYARELQAFVLERCRELYPAGIVPLYTDKPPVYFRQGWRVYEAAADSEIPSALLPRDSMFRFQKLDERMAQIKQIYNGGKVFDGKCLRSEKTWEEIFSAPEHEWFLDDDTYFLTRNGILLEAFSICPEHPVNRFTSRRGGLDDNKVMVLLQNDRFAAAVAGKSLIFPAADVF